MKSVRATLGTNAYFLQVILRIRFCNDTIVFRENAVLNKILGVVNTVTISPGMKPEMEQTDHGDENYAILLLGVLGCLFYTKRLSYNFELSLHLLTENNR